MRTKELVVLLVVVFWLLVLTALSHAQAAQVTATWVDKSDNEQGFRFIQVVPSVTPRPVLCEVGPNVTACSFAVPDVTRRCFVAVAYNSWGPSPDSNQACSGAPSPPGSAQIVITTTTTVTTPPPTVSVAP